jgi:hypothetical protein
MKGIKAMGKTGKLAEDRSNSTPIKQPWFCVGMLPPWQHHCSYWSGLLVGAEARLDTSENGLTVKTGT